MNKYLLLRDNKQTGPYTLEEIVAKGFKAYDLVWLEGKSAAWRYPSELPEFKQFAVVVEEQPYDRFYYKKPAADVTVPETASKKEVTTPVVAEIAPVAPAQEIAVAEKTPVVKSTPVKPKKIYVTMPAGTYGTTNGSSFAAAVNGNGNSNTNSASAIKAESVQPVQQETPVVKKDEYKKYEPLPAEIITEKKQAVKEPVIIDEPVNNYTAEVNVISIAPRKKRGAGKVLMLFLGAACLILGGIVIGLAISFNKQQTDKNKLETLVKEIQGRDKKNATEKATVPAPPPVMNAVITDSINNANRTTDSVATPSITDEASVKDSKQAGQRTKKDAGAQQPVTDNKSIAMTTANMNKDTDMKVTPAVVTSKDKTTYTLAALESARKNIYTLVSVESNKFKVGVLGGVSDLHLTISNNSSYPLDQVIVEVKYFGPEKKLVKTQSMLFNEVAAGEQKTLEVPRTTRGVTIDYSVTQINSRVLGLAQNK